MRQTSGSGENRNACRTSPGTHEVARSSTYKQRKVAHGAHRAANLRGRYDQLDQTLHKTTLCNPSILDWGQEFKITLSFSGHIINVRIFHFQASGQRQKK